MVLYPIHSCLIFLSLVVIKGSYNLYELQIMGFFFFFFFFFLEWIKRYCCCCCSLLYGQTKFLNRTIHKYSFLLPFFLKSDDFVWPNCTAWWNPYWDPFLWDLKSNMYLGGSLAYRSIYKIAVACRLHDVKWRHKVPQLAFAAFSTINRYKIYSTSKNIWVE